jgi:hypothetical protein
MILKRRKDDLGSQEQEDAPVILDKTLYKLLNLTIMKKKQLESLKSSKFEAFKGSELQHAFNVLGGRGL